MTESKETTNKEEGEEKTTATTSGNEGEGEGENKEGKSCCPRDSLGPPLVLHDQTPQGQMVEISSPEGLVGMKPMRCYLTGEPIASASRIVVVFTDVYGVEAGHHKVFADKLAERLSEKTGETASVLMPDLFRGVPILQPWMNNDNKTKDIMGSALGMPGMVYRMKTGYPPEKVEADIFHLIMPFIYDQLNLEDSQQSSNDDKNENKNKEELNQQQQKQPPKSLPKLSCVGFCFGGWVVGRVLGYRQRQSLRFQCGVGIHPSFQPNLLHGETPTTMAARIHRPILLLPAWNDVDMKPGTKTINTIKANAEVFLNKKKNMSASDKKNQFETTTTNTNDEEDDDELAMVSIEFPTMIHGWVSRGDPTDPNIAAEQERALQLTVDFIRKHTTSQATDDASMQLEEKLTASAL